jgi:adenylyltransferase/sulfurtransferase
VLLVGAGGLGSPAALVLARSGVGRVDVIDSDFVDATNLHRQTLYEVADVGAPKAPTAARRIEREGSLAGYQTRCVAREIHLAPDNASRVLHGYDLILEGCDNFASKFLTSDASFVASIPVVQAGAVRWTGWALATLPGRSACLRCVFEDIPHGHADTCADAGVLGPVVGVMGAVQAALALRLLSGDASAAGVLWSYDALRGRLRRRRIARRSDCALCTGRIRDTAGSRYVSPECAA